MLAQDLKTELIGRPFCNMTSGSDACAFPLSNPEYSLTIFIICLLCLFVFFSVISSAKPKRSVVVMESKYSPAELINYSIPYVVSFMGLGYDDTSKFIGMSIFLTWMFWLSHMSGQIIMNPVLIAFGWKFYEINYRHVGEQKLYTGFALARSEVSPDQEWRHTKVGDIMLLRSKEDRRVN
ncbi:MAG: hypothetical protein V2I43_26065 [Parvularcula sp.]|nr:hypothetical protein [Parvularcula sp.]